MLGKTADISKDVLLFLQNAKQKNSSLVVNSGMALGFDQLVCDVCLALDIPYIAVVPCDNQDAMWNDIQKKRYQALLLKAKEVVVVNPGPYEAWKMHARNKWIVDHSDLMLIHWDGYYQGGTGSCMKLVRAKKMAVTNTVRSIPI